MDLIVTVDTEEENLWSGSYRRIGCTVRNVRGVERFQQLCERFEIRPTYLVDWPVVEDAQAVGILRRIQDSGHAEIGTHLHPWCNPPLLEEASVRNSFMCNLPTELQEVKLQRLTDAIEKRFGRRPTSFRAGRYGMGLAGTRILARLGYIVDSSVIPFMDYTSEGGPDFSNAPYTPYYVGGSDIRQPCTRGWLLQVPVSVGFSRAGFKNAHRLRSLAGRRFFRSMHGVGILDRLGIARRIKFTPEQHSASDLNRLAEVYLRLRAPCIVMLLHSSSLVVGMSPYATNEKELQKLYSTLESVFEYCRRRLQLTTKTLSEFARNLNPPTCDSPARTSPKSNDGVRV